MVNRGIAPPQMATPIGIFRGLTGDTAYTPLDPPEPGFGNYEKFSDAEIGAYLAQADGSLNRAIGLSYLYLAGQAALESQSTADYDLKLDTTKRAADLRAIAQMWFGLADDEDLSSAEEAFEVVPTGKSGGAFIPEATPPIYGRQYTVGRWR